MRTVMALLVGAASLIGVVVVGTIAATVLLATPEGEVTTAYLAANLGVSFLAAAGAGYVTVQLAPSRPMIHAAGLAALIVVLSIGSGSQPAPGQPSWYPLLMPLLGLAGVAIGAVMSERRRRARRDA